MARPRIANDLSFDAPEFGLLITSHRHRIPRTRRGVVAIMPAVHGSPLSAGLVWATDEVHVVHSDEHETWNWKDQEVGTGSPLQDLVSAQTRVY